MAKQQLYDITVTYRSGAQFTFRCVDFTLRHNGVGELIGASWTTAQGEKFSPLLLSVGDVESVWRQVL